MGSQSTGLGVKNPRAKCAWRNLRPSSAWTHYYLSKFRLARLPDWPGTALTPGAPDDIQSAQSAESAQPRTPLRFSLLFTRSKPDNREFRKSRPSPSYLHVRGHEKSSRSTPWRLVRMRHGRQQAAGGYHPSFDFFLLPRQSGTVQLFISCPTYDAMSEWVSLADSFCGILPSRCPKDLTPGLLPSSPS